MIKALFHADSVMVRVCGQDSHEAAARDSRFREGSIAGLCSLWFIFAHKASVNIIFISRSENPSKAIGIGVVLPLLYRLQAPGLLLRLKQLAICYSNLEFAKVRDSWDSI